MKTNQNSQKPFIIVLGIAQDGGMPHAGCNRECCRRLWTHKKRWLHAATVAVVDPQTKQRWLIDITPDFKFQLAKLDTIFPLKEASSVLNGIFITHGHIGHYTGLLFLEKAVLNTKKIAVFVMPKMRRLLVNNRPWRDLIDNNHIRIFSLADEKSVRLNSRITIMPFLVPHRADREFSETVGFIIKGPGKKVLYLPDLDSWKGLIPPIEKLVGSVDLAFLDGTFFDENELPLRNIKEVPHPFIKESVTRFQKLSVNDKRKIHFIHMNHTNLVLKKNSPERTTVEKADFNIAVENRIFNI